MKVHYPKLYNMAHLLALNVLLLPKDLTIISICSQDPCKRDGPWPTEILFFSFSFIFLSRTKCAMIAKYDG